MKPLIAITVDVDFKPDDHRSRGKLSLNWNYAEQVALAGGNPILVTPLTDIESIFPMLDGWLIPGGADIDASRFGEENHPTVELQDPKRFEMEQRMYALCGPTFPIFGICYGAQFLNVQRGGTLMQHLPDQVHHELHSDGTIQRYEIKTGSKLASISNAVAIDGASYHHQAVGQLGEGLRVVATHEDGTVEAIEDPTLTFFIGLQWHPERTPNDEVTSDVFRSFITAAQEYRRSQ